LLQRLKCVLFSKANKIEVNKILAELESCEDVLVMCKRQMRIKYFELKSPPVGSKIYLTRSN